MKSKNQKQEEIKKGEKFLKDSQSLVMIDISKINTASLTKLRSELRKVGAPLLIIKKRLLGIILKKEGVDFQPNQSKLSTGTVFSPSLEDGARTVYKFLKDLEADKSAGLSKFIGGVDLKNKTLIGADQLRLIGSLPSREVLLSQLMGAISSPLRALLYVLEERSKKVVAPPSAN